MVRKIKRKLKNQAGESIGETLVALLIAAFALVMLAGAISSAGSMVTTSKKKIKEYYDTQGTAVEPGTANLTLSSSGTNADPTTVSTVSMTVTNIGIDYYTEGAFGENNKVISYKYKAPQPNTNDGSTDPTNLTDPADPINPSNDVNG